MTESKEIIYDLTDIKRQVMQYDNYKKLVSLLNEQISCLRDAISNLEQSMLIYQQNVQRVAKTLNISFQVSGSEEFASIQLQQQLDQISQCVIDLVQNPRIITKEIQVPVFVKQDVVIERIVQKPVEVIVEKERTIFVEKLIEVDRPIYIEREIQRPVYIQKVVEVEVDKPVTIYKIIEIDRPVFIQKIIEVPCSKCQNK